MFEWKIFAIFSLLICAEISCIDSDTLKYCCDLGISNANKGLKCDAIQIPINAIEKHDEAFCINSIDVCCTNQLKDTQCALGKSDAHAGACLKTAGQRKDCCDACLLGKQTGMSGQSCENFGLGPAYYKPFYDCCIIESSTTARTSLSTNANNALPPIENLCDIGDLCAQICIPGGDSYICKCNPGFALMADGISCKEINKTTMTSPATPKRANRCDANNPCEHNCTDTGVAIQCSCEDGFQLAKDKRSCKDIDECALAIHTCIKDIEICINGIGYYDCELLESEEDDWSEFSGKQCPIGYRFNGENQACDDIDECQIVLICNSNQKCVNTIGSYKCEEDKLDCPPGFYFKDATQYCEDIDECSTGQNDCNRESQTCLNTKGNFTCIDKASKTSCPAGFKMNLVTSTCEDINECLENPDLCEAGKECVNEPGGHTCVFMFLDHNATTIATPTISVTRPIVTSTITRKRTTPTTTTFKTTTFKTTTLKATTLKATTLKATTIKPTTPKPTTPKPTTVKPTNSATYATQLRNTINYLTTPLYPIYYKKPTLVSCLKGFAYSQTQNQCIDLDECLDRDTHTCDHYQDCHNTQGSYVCDCKQGFSKDFTGACVDINECQTNFDDCSDGQRCDNTVGSFICARVAGCGTGYTLNYDNGLCEDDDECLLGTHHCNHIGANWKCVNSKGSYRCIRVSKVSIVPIRDGVPSALPSSGSASQQPGDTIRHQISRCLPGYFMNPFGYCQDVNECESNPCRRGQKCINLNGRYECISNIECKGGFELNEAGDDCIDINECTRGTHSCSGSQICKNAIGYHMCLCQMGYKRVQNECIDINECELYKGRSCSMNADCINTIGSYTCRCKDGFREEDNSCLDINECKRVNGGCSQICVNVLGNHRCACQRGFTLNADNRTCVDIDECETHKDQTLCIGTCVNTPGSYVCQCPAGYKIGSDERTCQDIDECMINSPCTGRDEICYNTRGSYACPAMTCPTDYARDSDHKSRCKRNRSSLQGGAVAGPQYYSYHFVSFVSRLPLINGKAIDFFQMKGPGWRGCTEKFNLTLENVHCPHGVERVNANYLRLTRLNHKAIVSVVRPIEGPQQIELSLEMQLYKEGYYTGTLISKVFIFVSEYTF